MKVFVYGTLKSGHGNHGVLDGATFIGNGITDRVYRMFHAGFPVVRHEGARPEENAPVYGEVYEVDKATLKRLDRLESNGHMYNRERTVIVMENGSQVVASLYVGDSEFWKGQPLYETSEGLYIWPAEIRS